MAERFQAWIAEASAEPVAVTPKRPLSSVVADEVSSRTTTDSTRVVDLSPFEGLNAVLRDRPEHGVPTCVCAASTRAVVGTDTGRIVVVPPPWADATGSHRYDVLRVAPPDAPLTDVVTTVDVATIVRGGGKTQVVCAAGHASGRVCFYDLKTKVCVYTLNALTLKTIERVRFFDADGSFVVVDASGSAWKFRLTRMGLNNALALYSTDRKQCLLNGAQGQIESADVWLSRYLMFSNARATYLVDLKTSDVVETWERLKTDSSHVSCCATTVLNKTIMLRASGRLIEWRISDSECGSRRMTEDILALEPLDDSYVCALSESYVVYVLNLKLDRVLDSVDASNMLLSWFNGKCPVLNGFDETQGLKSFSETFRSSNGTICALDSSDRLVKILSRNDPCTRAVHLIQKGQTLLGMSVSMKARKTADDESLLSTYLSFPEVDPWVCFEYEHEFLTPQTARLIHEACVENSSYPSALEAYMEECAECYPPQAWHTLIDAPSTDLKALTNVLLKNSGKIISNVDVNSLLRKTKTKSIVSACRLYATFLNDFETPCDLLSKAKNYPMLLLFLRFSLLNLSFPFGDETVQSRVVVARWAFSNSKLLEFFLTSNEYASAFLEGVYAVAMDSPPSQAFEDDEASYGPLENVLPDPNFDEEFSISGFFTPSGIQLDSKEVCVGKTQMTHAVIRASKGAPVLSDFLTKRANEASLPALSVESLEKLAESASDDQMATICRENQPHASIVEWDEANFPKTHLITTKSKNYEHLLTLYAAHLPNEVFAFIESNDLKSEVLKAFFPRLIEIDPIKASGMMSDGDIEELVRSLDGGDEKTTLSKNAYEFLKTMPVERIRHATQLLSRFLSAICEYEAPSAVCEWLTLNEGKYPLDLAMSVVSKFEEHITSKAFLYEKSGGVEVALECLLGNDEVSHACSLCFRSSGLLVDECQKMWFPTLKALLIANDSNDDETLSEMLSSDELYEHMRAMDLHFLVDLLVESKSLFGVKEVLTRRRVFADVYAAATACSRMDNSEMRTETERVLKTGVSSVHLKLKERKPGALEFVRSSGEEDYEFCEEVVVVARQRRAAHLTTPSSRSLLDGTSFELDPRRRRA